jgi:hypothetical protein
MSYIVNKNNRSFIFSKTNFFFFFSLGQHIGHNILNLDYFMHSFLYCIHKQLCVLSLKDLIFFFLFLKNLFKASFKNILIVSYDISLKRLLNFSISTHFFFAFGT